MHGFLMALITFFTNMKKVQQQKTKVAKQRLGDVRQRLQEKKEIVFNQNSQTSNPKIIDKVLSPLIYLIALIMAFIEILIIFIVLMQFAIIFLLVIIVVVVIFTFMSFIQNILGNDQADFDKPETGNACYQRIEGQLQWTLEELNAKGTTLKTAQKNQYKLGILARDNFEGTTTGRKMLDIRGLGVDKKVLFAIGLLSTEGMASNMDSIDIMKDVANVGVNSSGYGYFGISVNDRLYNYLSGQEVTKLKDKYSPSTTPPYESAFAPWGMVMSIGHQQSKYNSYTGRDSVSEKIDKIAKEWGISANINEFKGYTTLFLTQAQYHGAEMVEYDAYINWFAAIFALSHTDDSRRSFHNYQLVVNEGKSAPYNEGGATRSIYIGEQDYAKVDNYSSPSEFPGLSSNLQVKLHLNGNPINESLWSYIAKNQKNPTGFNKSVEKLKEFGRSAGDKGSGGGKGARVLNFHYGLNSLWQGQRIESDLAKDMSLSGQTKSEMVCSDGTVTLPPPGTYAETPGQSQLIVAGKPLKQFMEEYYEKTTSARSKYLSSLEKYWGTSNYLSNDKNPARVAGYTDKVHGVPFFGQGKSYEEGFLYEPYAINGDTYLWSGCMIYAYAYTVSSQLKVLVNPTEIGSLLHTYGALGPGGVNTELVPKMMKDLGLQTKKYAKYDENGLKGWDETLDKGGVIIIRTHPGKAISGIAKINGGFFTKSEHFQVITGKQEVDGKTMYSMYTSSYHGQSMALYTYEELKPNIDLDENNPVMHVWK